MFKKILLTAYPEAKKRMFGLDRFIPDISLQELLQKPWFVESLKKMKQDGFAVLNDVHADGKDRMERVKIAFAKVSLEWLENATKFADTPIIGDLLGDIVMAIGLAGVGLQLTAATLESMRIILGLDKVAIRELQKQSSFPIISWELQSIIDQLAANQAEYLTVAERNTIATKAIAMFEKMNHYLELQSNNLKATHGETSDEYLNHSHFARSLVHYETLTLNALNKDKPQSAEVLWRFLFTKELLCTDTE